MKCIEIHDKFIDFIENNLTKEAHDEIVEHLEICDSCSNELIELQQLLEVINDDTNELPSERLRKSFEEHLDIEKKQQTRVIELKSRFNYKTLLKFAAGLALLISTFLAGRYQQNEQVAKLESESLNNKQTVMLALMENKSASKRIQGVQYIEEFSDPDPQIVDALVKRMLYDENTNVRLTAASALDAFISSEAVKEGFIKALETEKDPTIQINIIKSLVKIQEKKAIKPMQRLLEQDETQSFVKDEIKTVLTNKI